MKFLIAISIIFAVYVSSQDGNEEIANKIGYDVIEKLFNLFKKQDVEGLKAIYDDLFRFEVCKEIYSKSDSIVIGLTNNQYKNVFNVTKGVLTDLELRFHMVSRFLDELEDIDYVDYIWKRETVNDQWTLWRMNFTRCD